MIICTLQFGHALQHLLTTVEYSDIAGLSFVEWDAVFVCDFFMENWYKIKLSVYSIHLSTFLVSFLFCCYYCN